jgi:hypothetical protein
MPCLQFIGVLQQQFHQDSSIRGVGFGARRRERLAIFGDCLRIDRVDHKKIVFAERVNQRSSFLFCADGDRPGRETGNVSNLLLIFLKGSRSEPFKKINNRSSTAPKLYAELFVKNLNVLSVKVLAEG